jgi:protein O-GlcNAc transferase
LSRLGCSDVFLDTPSYNAHTLGCDALWAGVPMISLLRPLDAIPPSDGLFFVPTDKLASRVGASLLTAAGLDDWIVPDLSSYQELMIQAVTDRVWFGNSVEHLIRTKSSCPLFDTQRWVENFELALRQIGLGDASRKADILILFTPEDGSIL